MKGTEYNRPDWLPEPTAWDKLPMKSRADIIEVGFRHGLSSIEDIKTAYNRTVAGEDIYGEGGLVHPSIKRARLEAFDRFLTTGRVENRYDGITEDTQQMNAPNIFRRPNGTYFYQSPEGEEVVVTPIMTTLGDESMWTYQDESGRRYTPKYSTDEGSIVQGEMPSTWDRIIAASNRNYFDPVLGAPARWKASWENNTNPIKAVWDNPAITGHPLGMAAKAAEYLLSEEGLKKTKRLYDNWDGFDNSTYYLTRSLAGDALAGLGLLSAVSQGYKAGKQFAQDNYLGAFGKPVVSENYSVLSPTIRTRVGDVEINNPGLNYRVGTQDIVDDFVNTGIVRAGETNHQRTGKAGRFLLTKETFTNPMFKEGSLWYQPSEEMNGLLVTSKPMQWATKSSAPLANDGVFTIQGKTFANDMGGRRIPYEGQVLDASNTTAYTYDPSYGYRRVFLKGAPAAEWAEDPTDNLLKWLGKEGSSPDKSAVEYLMDKYNPEYRRMAKILADNGVDLNRVAYDDIKTIYNKRMEELLNNGLERFTVARPIGETGYSLSDFVSGRSYPVGETDLSMTDDGTALMSNIVNYQRNADAPIKGVQERGLNSAINVSKSVGGNGVITGKEYQSAPKQYHVVQKFHDRELIGRDGIHSNTNMVTDYRKAHGIYDDGEETMANSILNLARAGEKERKVLFGAPYWKLKTPIYHVPTKSILFDPRNIDNNGVMHIDWDNPFIFSYGGNIKKK